MLATSLAGAQTIQIDGELFRDPTQPPSAVFSMTVVDTMQVVEIEAAQALLSTLTLNFIRAGGLEPVAVINRQPYRIGDNLETAVVSDIRSGEVELTIEGVKHVLTMFSRPVRQSDGQ
ncbi:hypothetical protein E3V39_06900 [Gammaproteobacteria bacterium LSUCC0112]|nr:hypothetical protein E3V39_06900 [Gammaproteobacteria bacterium LSUCC0112]